ncbi:MAG: sigma-70 family RNA polymerase sigma factor [Oscillospiraceae bacterium]|nr:sigma-70 family RNA polymerase sigma factor [Oscillospiraceae bacterium]
MENTPPISDEALCQLAQQGDGEAAEQLIVRYMRAVRASMQSLFLNGGDPEDLLQEGLMGLLKAIRSFDPTKNASFRTFAQLCVRNRLYSAVKAANRDKHEPLNRYVSIQAPFADSEISPTTDFVLYPDRYLDPETLVIRREEAHELTGMWKGLLSGLEAEILGHYLEGLSYREIAAITHKSPKSVDNAVHRARKKLAQHWR